jgi:hypothetical protein
MVASVALLVTRWGSWPQFIALYLHTVAHNPSIDFLLLGDTPVPAPLPANARFLHVTLGDLLRRLRRTTADVIADARALRDNDAKDGFFGGGGTGNAAKTNDFKPL